MTVQPWQPTTFQQPTAVADYQTRAIARLSDWATAADAAYRTATRLVETAFVPQQFRGKPVEATAAILAGSEVGLSPMAALRAFDIIQGQAAPRALTLRAIAQSYGHDIELIESTSTRCKVRARRRGGDWQAVTWTIDRAKELGLTSKDNWRKQPGAMLVARATSEAARLVAADAILGIGYSAEEVADGAGPGAGPESTAATETVTATPTGTRRMSRHVVPDDEPEADAANAETPEPSLTDAQGRAMHAAFRDAGITDRDQRLAYCANLIGRPLTSSKYLTVGEASRVIDALKADTDGTLPVGGEDRG